MHMTTFKTALAAGLLATGAWLAGSLTIAAMLGRQLPKVEQMMREARDDLLGERRRARGVERGEHDVRGHDHRQLRGRRELERRELDLLEAVPRMIDLR